MCGLSGTAGTVTYREENVAKTLLYMNALRGEDSSGCAVQPVAKEKGEIIDPEVRVMIGPSQYLMEMKRYTALFAYQTRLVMNHNRSATIGPKTNQFAQPYQFTNVTGTHNGTVPLFDVRDLPNGKNAESDSKTIIECIDLHGIQKTIPLLPTGYNAGAWALVWYDKRDDTLNFLRNDQRPLYYCFSEDRKCIFWSSEVEMLVSAVNRHEIKRKKDEKCSFLAENTWVKWKIPDREQPFGESTRIKVEGKAKPVYNSYGHTFSGGQNGSKSDGPFTTNGSGGSKNIIPADAAARTLVMGKDKFPLVYRDETVKVYYDTNTHFYHRYWWDKSEKKFHHSELMVAPLELNGHSIDDIIKRDVIIVGTTSHPENRAVVDAPWDKDVEAMRFKGASVVVTKKKKESTKPWNLWVWNNKNASWAIYEDSFPPTILPDTQYDINSSHMFQHIGKKEKKVIVFKTGINGKLLTRDAFNELTNFGCFNCGRAPTWNKGRMGGVRVKFFTDVNFLCEYCAEDDKLFNQCKQAASVHKSHNNMPNDPLPTLN